ncbi:PD-(D/E)XK nuclease family protein [Haloferula sp. A504]|uniref:PD-(D/E)XK nuclease family protein n=1 Tax=Haloferula sp. A504 TaxID=3373601 RepID=UPI0031C86021|nr:PD-(D/E)XK nuclease family protein [Verrucomicrobiaceae bacterium E54]
MSLTLVEQIARQSPAPPVEPVTSEVPDHISPTAAKSYLACSLRFYFERVLCLPRPTSPALHLGKSIHAALQCFHIALWRGGDCSPETIALAFDGAFNALEKDEGPIAWTAKKTREKAREDGLRVVAAYLDSPEVAKEPPKAVEVFLHENIDGLSVPLTGAMDLVRQDLTPVDFKSAAARPDSDTAAFEHEIQLVSYQLMLEAATGESPPSLELVYLVKTKTPQVIKVTSPPADRHRKERVVRLLETAVKGITAARFHPQPGMQCSWCQFRKECAAWKGGAS